MFAIDFWISLKEDFTEKMNPNMLHICLFATISIFCGEIFCAEGTETQQAIQILSPKRNDTFLLEYNEIERIFNSDEIKDRKVVVVSIVGAFRQGKSFLLNIFLKYLYAQVYFCLVDVSKNIQIQMSVHFDVLFITKVSSFYSAVPQTRCVRLAW